MKFLLFVGGEGESDSVKQIYFLPLSVLSILYLYNIYLYDIYLSNIYIIFGIPLSLVQHFRKLLCRCICVYFF